MSTPPNPDNPRAARLRALASYALTAAGPEAALDDLVRVAAHACNASVGLVTLVDEARQFFRAGFGHAGENEAPLDVGFCPLVVEAGEPLVIPDALADPRHADNPATAGGVRFYAGVPLVTAEHHVLGTLCVLDPVPRPGGLDPREVEVLRILAGQVVSQFELRRTTARQEALLAEQRAVIEEHEALRRAQAAVGAASGDPATILAAVLEGAMAAVPEAEGAVVELVEGDVLVYRAASGTLEPHLGLRLPLHGSLAGRCLRERTPLLATDVLRDGEVPSALAACLRLRSAVLAPIERGAEALGVLKLQADRPNAFGPRALPLLRLFAGLATAGLTEVRAAAAEKAVLAGERRQQAIFDSTTQFAIIVTDRAGEVTDWNSGAHRLLGWSAADMLGRTVERIFTPEDRAGHRAAVEMRAALETGRAEDERWHLRADGTRFWASGEMMPLLDGENEHLGYVKVLRDRTEAHLAGRALEAVTERFRQVQRATRDAIWDRDLRTDHVLWNEALHTAYGWAPDAVASTAGWWIGRIHPADRDGVDRSLRAVVDGDGNAWTAEYRFRRADGGYADVLDRGYVIRDEAGQPLRMIGAMFDQSALRRADAALREGESRLRLATAAARIGTFDYWVNTGELIWDDRCRELFGIAPGAPVSYENTFLPGLHPADRAGTEEAVRRALAPEGSGRFGCEYRTVGPSDGAERWVSANGEAFFEGGQPSRLIGTVLDITRRKRAEATIAALNARLAEQVQQRTRERDRLWDISTDLLAVWDADGRCRNVNPAWTGKLGRPAEQLIGRRPADLVHADDAPALAAALRDALAGRPPQDLDLRVRHEDGTWRVHGWTFVAADGEVYATGHDATERRRLEEELRQSQKMEAVGQLTGGLAHDFNNLLTGISGSLELLARRVAEGRVAELDRYLRAAQGAARRAAALTHRLLAFSRRQTLEPRATALDRLVGDMTELIRRTVGPAIAVESTIPPELWNVLVDPGQTENALLNLCINARDAMPNGGRIDVSAANRRLDEREAAERELLPGAYVVLSVADTGCGMAPEVAARAFDPFFTTKPLGEGTGLGLSMIYGFVRQSGGRARIQSEPGRGTTVHLYLPRHLGEAEPAEPLPVPGDVPRARAGETVLVVDDEATVRMLVTEVLEELGYAALQAADGAAGLRLLQSDARIDLLVTDVGLPGGMNGRQMADAARLHRPGLTVLFITGYAENAALGEGQLEPGLHVLTKPFALDVLATRIRELIRSE